MTTEDPSKPGSIWDKFSPEAKVLFGGAFAVEFLQGATAWEHLNVAMSEVGFRISTGAALLVASLIPGDGVLRLIELVAGGVFLLFGFAHAKSVTYLLIAYIGRLGFDIYMKATEEQRKLFLPIITAIFTKPGAATAQTKTTTSAPNPVAAPSSVAESAQSEKTLGTISQA